MSVLDSHFLYWQRNSWGNTDQSYTHILSGVQSSVTYLFFQYRVIRKILIRTKMGIKNMFKYRNVIFWSLGIGYNYLHQQFSRCMQDSNFKHILSFRSWSSFNSMTSSSWISSGTFSVLNFNSKRVSNHISDWHHYIFWDITIKMSLRFWRWRWCKMFCLTSTVNRCQPSFSMFEMLNSYSPQLYWSIPSLILHINARNLSSNTKTFAVPSNLLFSKPCNNYKFNLFY